MKTEELRFNKNKDKIIKTLTNAQESKYYYDLFQKNGIKLDRIGCYEDFKKIPILTKNLYKDNCYDLIKNTIAERIDKTQVDKLIRVDKKKELRKFDINLIATSGSTGEPLNVFRHKDDEYRDFFLANIHRNKVVEGIFKKKFLWLWPITRAQQNLYYNTNQGFEKLDNGYKYFLNEYSTENFINLYDFIIKEKIEWITGSPSALYLFSNFILNQKLKPISTIRYIECNSEYLYEFQIENIKKVFNVTPINVYASNETLFIGMTCNKGNMHILDESVFVELIANENNINEVIITKLNNKYIPLIRYNLGDYAEWNENECDCKFFYSPVIQLKSFRKNDCILKKNGEMIEPLSIVEVILNIKQRGINIQQYQYIQIDYDRFEVYLSNNNSIFTQEMRNFIYIDMKKFFKKLLDCDVKIDIIYSDNILPPDPLSGKFKYFVNRINTKRGEQK
jgi:phenylacetate-CoA ligase